MLSEPATIELIRTFLCENFVVTLNVAGNRESKSPGIEVAVRRFVTCALV